MIVKKFVGETFHEACQKIKDELGSDAMILQTNRIKVGGFLGFFGRWMFEVIAQANPPVTPPHGIPAGSLHSGAANVASVPAASHTAALAAFGAALAGGTIPAMGSHPSGAVPQPAYAPQPAHPGVPAYAAHAQPAPVPPQPAAPQPMGMHAIANVEIPQPAEMTAIRAELDDLKKKIDLLVSTSLAARPASGAVAAPPEPRAVVESVVPVARGETGALREMMDLLTGSELEPALRGQIRTHLLETTPEEDLENLRTLKDRVIDYLSRSLISHKGIEVARGTTQKVVAVVGPTGVGKTTTLAKLGAGLKFNLNLEVGFLTLDTYRIAAPEQLKKYGEIIDVPVEVVFRPENLSDAIKQFHDKDVVLIDTAGRNSKNRADMLDLVRFLDCGVPVETYLVLSANTKYTDLVEIIENFKDLSPTNLILTKLDETSSFGSMISLLSRTKKGVSYVTTGQNVPEDIMPASPAKLARLLFERRLVA